MKTIKRLVLAFVILLLTGCSLIFKTVDYKVDTTEFKNVVAYQEEVDIAGLKIVETINGTATKIPVDKSMVTSCDPTSSLGDKTLTLTYKEKTFTVKFTVKYRVNFTSGSEVLYTQYVTKASEIHAPNDPYKPGYEFDGWSPEIPNAINDNITFEAEFRDTPKEIPNLATSYDAVYGDTLADIDLPSNVYGKWEFIDSLSTPVGNVGKNTFNVQFTPTNVELTVVKSTATVYVSKMHLDFNFTKLQFDYDGLEHTPLYTLVNTKGETVEDPAITVNYTGQKGKEVGTYFYAYTINSDNYEGNAMGYFDVVANKVTITIADSSINLGDTVPNFTLVSSKDDLKPFTYLVEGVDPSVIPLLNIQISVPKINNAGEYDISASVNNENYKDVVVNKGKLIVNKLTLGANDLTITSQPIYGDKLSDVTIADDNPNGYWSWVDGNTVLDHAGEFEADAVFTPYSQNYELEYKTFKINVARRTLSISIVNNSDTYVYDGLEHTVTYKVEGFALDDTINDIEIIGNVKGTNAGIISSKLEVVADNYIGELPITLVINKAIPETDFNRVIDNVYVNTRLNEIILPEGYKWDAGGTQLVAGENQKFPVTYTPGDEDNYEIVYGEFTVNVIKYTPTIAVKDLYTFKYNGEVHTLTDVRASHTESELVYKYFLNGQEIENIRNAGEYRVVITLPESHSYYEKVIEVAAIVETIGVSPEPSVYDATYGDTLGSILLPTSIYGSWSWKDGNDTLVGDAGENIHVAVFTSSNPNYKTYEVEVKVIVAKKTLDIIVNDEDNIYDYDGNAHTVTYTLEGIFDYDEDKVIKVSNKDIAYTDAGNYLINLIIDDENYKGNKQVSLKINKVNPVVDEPLLGENGEIIWNTNAFAYNELLPDGFMFKENYLFDTVGTDLEYTLIYTPTDTKNYNTIEVTAYISVSKATPTITYREQAYTYNGKVVTLNASTSNTDEVTLEYSYKLDGVEVNEIKDAGTYEVVITSPESINYEEVSKTVSVTVDRKAVSVIWHINPSYTYSVNGQVLPTAEFVNVSGGYVDLDVEFVDLLNEENDSFKNASTYKFTALVDEFTNNYLFSGVESADVVINKANVDTSNASWSNNSFSYDGKEHTVQLNNVTWPSDVTVKYTGNKATNAGDYEATVSFVYDSNNYNTISVEKPTHDWSISTTGVVVIWENNENRTYTGEEFEMPSAYINGVSGKLYLEVSMDKAVFKDAGNYVFKATDLSGNYELIDDECNVVVSAASLIVVWDDQEDRVYTGEELAYPTAAVETFEGNVSLVPTILYGGNEFVVVNKYKFTVTFNNPNYTITNVESEEIEILKATYDMSGAKWDYVDVFTFSNEEKEVKVIGLPDGVSVESYMDNEKVDAGTYTAKAVLSYDEHNYNDISIDDLTWTINPLEVEVTWSNDEDRVYENKQFSLPEASFVDLNGNEALLIIKEQNNKVFRNAGTYTFIASISTTHEGYNNYVITNTTSVEIEKASLDAPELEATYGDELGEVNLPTSTFGTWSLATGTNVLDKVGNKGTQLIYLDFTSSDDNYKSLTNVEATLEVAAKAITGSITANGGKYGSVVASTATLTGVEAKDTVEITLTYVGTANDGTKHNSTTVPENAGTYEVIATISDDNYSLSQTKSAFLVEKADPATYFNSSVFDVDWSSKLEDIDLSSVTKDVDGTYVFANPTTVLESVGNGQVFEAKFVPTDLNNYNEVEGAFVVNVLGGLDSSITANETYTFTYDGSAKEITATGSHSEVELEYVYKLNGVEVDEMVNAATYEVVITLPETEHYAKAEKTVSVKISPKTVDVTWDVASKYTYSVNGQETPKAYVLKVDGNWAEINVAESNGKAFKDAGTYSFEASLTDDLNTNYVLGNNIVSNNITISKATINLSSSKWNYTSAFTYNGSAQGVAVTGVTLPSDVTIDYANNSKTTAGSYIASASLNYDLNNYDVTGSLPADLTWNIAKKEATVVWENTNDRIYTSSAFDNPTAYIVDVFGQRYDLTVTKTTLANFVNVGSYDFKVEEESNYELANDTANIKVNAASLEVVWEIGSYEYTGEELTKPVAYVTDLKDNKIELSVTILDGFSLFKNAGDYIFTAAFGDYSEKDNYTLTNVDSSLVKVNKASIDMKDVKWSYTSAFTYNGNVYSVEVINLPTLVTAKEYTGTTEATNADTYQATATLSYDADNYELINNSLSSLTWTINPKEIEIIWSEDNYVYTGNNLAYPTATYTDVDISVNRGFEGLFKNAGSYNFTASTTDTNYTILNPTKSYSVAPKQLDLPTGLEATYGDTLGDVALPTSSYGTWSFDNNSTSVGDAGNNSFTIIFTSTDTNYASFSKSVLVKVNAKEVTVSITPNGGTYDDIITGAEATVSGYVDAEAPSVTLTYTGTANDGTAYNSTNVPSKAGTYTVTATIADKNYKLGLTTETFVVDRAIAEITNNLVSSSDYDGLEVDITPYFELNHEEVTLSYVITGKAATIKDAGTYYISVSAAQSANYEKASLDNITYVVNKIDATLEYVGETNYTYNSGSFYTINDSDIRTNNTDTGYTFTKVIKLNGNTVLSIHEAGSYSVSITISSTTNFNKKTLDFTIEVAKGSINPGNITTSINATYGQKLGDFDLPEANDGTWSWKDGDATEVGDVGNQDHIAVFTPTDTSLNIVEKTVTFNVSPQPITIKITSEKTFVYDEQEKEITYLLSKIPAGVSVNVTGTQSATVVGNYSVTFTITGNTNYTGSATVSWSITKATPTYTAPTGLQATYLDKLSSVSLPDGWAWVDTNPETTVGNAGNRTHQAVFTPEDTDNYNTATVGLVIEVAKKEYTPTVSGTAASATYGDLLSSVTLEGEDSYGKWIWKTPTNRVGDVGSNSHEIVFDLFDKDNYYVASGSTADVSVNALDITVIITPNGGTYAGTINGATANPVGYVEGAKPEVTLTYTGVANDGTEYNGTTVPTHAGNYTVTASIEDTNYNLTGTVTASFNVAKATPAGSFSAETSFEWGKTLGELGLAFSSSVPGTATWVDGANAKPEVTNGTTYAVLFTPNDTDNYEVVDDSVTLVVSKVTTEITSTSATYEFTYGDHENFLSVLGATLTPNNDEQTIKFYNGEDEVTSISDADTYVIVIKVEESTHYKASSTTVTIIVNRKEEQVVMDEEFEYGSTITHVEESVQESEFGTFTIYESDPNEPQISLLSTYKPLLGVANTEKTIWVSFVPYTKYEKNYKPHIKVIVIKIIKKNVTVNINSDGGFYGNVQSASATLNGILDGEEAPTITLTYTGETNAGEVYNSTNVPTEAGKYTVTATIEAVNYVLTGTVSDDFIISKATPSVVEPAAFDKYWNEKLGDISLSEMVAKDPTSNATLDGTFAWNEPTTILDTVGDNQVFSATFTPNDTNNYEVVDNVEFKVDVNRIETTVRYEGLDGLVYEPNKVVEIEPIVNHNEKTPVIEILYGANKEPVANLTKAGTYTVKVTIAESAHYTAYNGEAFEVKVEKATPSTNFVDQAKIVTWNDSLKLKDFTLNPGYAWDYPNTDLDNIETKSYSVTYTPTDTVNYKTVTDEVSVTVIKADGNVSANDSYEFVYKHAEYKVADLEGIVVNHSESKVVIDKVLLNADTYLVTITLPESTHYNEATTTTTVVIKKAVEAQPDKLTGSYGTELGNISLPTSTNGTWSLATSMNPLAVYDAGEHDVTLTFTASTNNYESKDYTVKLVISPIAYEPTSIATANATYGDKLSTTSLVGGDNTGTWTWKDTNVETLVGNAGTQDHVAVFTPTSGNYLPSEHVISVVIAKKEVTFNVYQDTFDFDEKTHYVKYVLYGLLGEDDPRVTGNTGWRNVAESGTAYSLAVDDDNYEGDVSGIITIKKVDPNVDFSKVVGYGKYGQPLSTVSLPTGFTFNQPTRIMDELYEQSYDATYVHPTESANYNTVIGTVIVVVDKGDYDMSGVTWDYSEPFTYNKNSHTVTVSNLPNGVTVKEYTDNIKTDAGEYEATVKFNYDEDHYNEPSIDPLTWEIKATRVAIELEESYPYGSTIFDIVPKASEFGTFEVNHKHGDHVDGTILGNAGEKVTVIVTFTSTNKNYESYFDEVEFVIAKKELTFENIVSVYDYDEKPHTVTYTLNGVVGNDNPTVIGNKSILTVAESTTVKLVIDEANYYGEVEVELTINQGTPVTDFTTVYKAEYNTKLSDIVLPEGYSWKNGNLSLTTIANGQKFDAVYTPADTVNYKVINGQFTVNVTKINTIVTINKNDWTGKTYNPIVEPYQVVASLSSEATPTVTIGYNESTTAKEDDQYVTVTNLFNAGTYKIEVTASETETYSAVNETYFVVINQAKQAVFDKSYNIAWKEGLTLSEVTGLPNGYTWKDGTTSLNEIGAKDYAVIYTPTDRVNYMVEEGTFNVTVNKADAGQITADTNYSLGEYKEEGYTIADLHNVVYPHSESTPYINVTLKDAKSYEVTITLPESTHYLEETITINVWIKKKMLSIPTGLQATYGDTLADVELPTSEFGKWVFVNDGSTSVGNAGEQTFAINFIPSNDNYDLVEGNIRINVLKQVTEVTTNIPKDLVFNDVTFAYTDWFVTNSTAEPSFVITLNGTSVNEVKNAGSYKIEVTVSNSDNFTEFKDSYSFIVKQAAYSPIGLPTIGKAEYGNLLGNISLSGGDQTGEWSWALPDSLVGNLGTQKHSLLFTPTDTNFAPSNHLVDVIVSAKSVTIHIIDGDENNNVKYTYNGKHQQVLFEIKDGENIIYSNDGRTFDNAINFTQTTDDDAIDAGKYLYTLSINDNNYQAETVSGILEIVKANPSVSFDIPEDAKFYEDRITSNDITDLGTSSVEGKITLDSALIYRGTNSTSPLTISWKFTPKDTKNYNVVYGNVEIVMLPVAYIDSMYYGTVEKALNAATSGKTVYVIVGSNAIIKNNATVKANVTLMLQYEKGKANNTTAKVHGDTDAKYRTVFGEVTSNLTIAPNVVLTNNGTIEIGGILTGSGGGYIAGHTVEKYAQINLDTNAKINSTGIINCFGFIKETSKNNGSSINITSGTIYMPFVLRDFQGGSYMKAVYDNMETEHASAFNEFIFNNVTAKLRINYGAFFKAWGNLYASRSVHHTDVSVVGNTTSYLIQLTDSKYSYLEAKYDESTNVLDLDIYGGAQTNAMVLSVAGTKISTKSVYFPLSWQYDVSLNPNKEAGQSNAVYNINQRFKVMTGAKLRVEEGATLNASELIIYSSFDQTMEGSTVPVKYPNDKPAGQFIVNGEVVASYLAGQILTENTGAVLQVTTGSTMTSKEVFKHTAGGSLFGNNTVDEWITINKSLNGYMVVDGIVQTTTSTMDIGVYCSINGGWSIAENAYSFNVNFNTNGGNEIATKTYYSLNPTMNLTQSLLPTPIKQHYSFLGWYLDEGLEIPLESEIMDANGLLEVYAKWEYTSYQLSLSVEVQNGETESTHEVVGNITFDYGMSNITVDTYSRDGYYFYGWYLLPDCSLETYLGNGTYTFDEIINLFPNGNTAATLYGILSTKPYYDVQFNYYMGSGLIENLSYETVKLKLIEGTVISLVEYEMYTDKEGYRFTHWEDESGNEYLSNDIIEINGLITLTAKYDINEFTISFDGNGGTADKSSMSGKYMETIKLPNATRSDYSFNGWTENDTNVGGSGADYVIKGNVTLKASWSKNCVAEGTLITMADGSKKEVQFIESGDLLYVFNHETGKWDIAEVLFNDSEPLSEFTVINLEFSNGSFVKVVSEHGFFDLELMKYVYITEQNYHEFVGHRFVSGTCNGNSIDSGVVTLNKAYITYETIRVYSPVTKYHLNYLTEDLLSMPGGVSGIFNIFEYDETLKYDEELMNADIEKYGVFTYEDFQELVAEDIYNSFPTQYFAIAIGKGILTWEQLYYYIERYAPLM